MEYTSPVWFLPATSDLNCLDAVQNRAACWACGSIYVARWHRDKKQWSKSTNVSLTHLQWPSLHFTTGEVFCYYLNYTAYFMDSYHYHFMSTFTSQRVKHDLIPCLST